MALGTSGGGGSAGAIQAGKANVKLGITDDVTPKLRELKEKFKEFGSETKKELAKAGRGNLFGEFFKGGGMGFGSSLASASVEAIGKGIKEIIFGSKTLDDSVKAWNDSLQEVASTVQTIKTRFGEMAEDAKPQERRGLIDQEAARIRTEMERLVKERDAIEGGLFKFRRATSTGTPLGTARTWAFWMGDQLSMTERVSTQEAKGVEGIKAYNEAINKLAEDIRLLERQGKKTDPFPQATALTDQLEKARDELKFDEQIANPETTDRMKQLIRLQRELDKVRKDGEFPYIEGQIKQLENIVKIADAEEKAFNEKRKQAEELKKIAEDANKAQHDALLGAAKDIELGRLTQGLSPEAARMARLVDQGLTNDQIMQLQRLERIARATTPGGGDFMSRGGLASADLARSLGIADQWTQMKKEAELTNAKLDEIRGVMNQLPRLLGFKN